MIDYRSNEWPGKVEISIREMTHFGVRFSSLVSNWHGQNCGLSLNKVLLLNHAQE